MSIKRNFVYVLFIGFQRLLQCQKDLDVNMLVHLYVNTLQHGLRNTVATKFGLQMLNLQHK